MNFEKAFKITKEFDQSHLLNFFKELKECEQETLLKELSKIDFKLIKKLCAGSHSSEENPEPSITPIESSALDSMDLKRKSQLTSIGLDKLKQGKVAAFLVAGGQGSRLGHDGPKGSFSIGLPSGKSIFNLHAERLLELSKECGKTIPWYIMTSPVNHEDTIEFFKSHNNFGYPSDDLMFFSQGLLPAVDQTGNILLEEKFKPAMSPSGNGDCLISLKNTGMLDDMKKRGIEWLSLYGVDNVLAKPADPIFIGFTIDSNALIGSKSVSKKSPEEKTGVFCMKNGHPSILEYSEITDEMAHSRKNDGSLVYGDSNILNHLLHIDFVENSLNAEVEYHTAHKAVKHVDSSGSLVSPTAPNAIKFERFIFDFFMLTDKMAVLTVNREEEFAPVKNKEGNDSPQTAREMYLNQYPEK